MAEEKRQPAKPTPILPPMVMRGLVGLCAALAVADFMIYRTSYSALEALPLFFPLLGAVAMTAVMLVSFAIKRLLIRPEAYYELRHAPKDTGDDNA